MYRGSRVNTLLSTLAVFIAALATLALGAAAQTVTEVTLLHDTNLRGEFGDEVSLAHFAALVEQVRARQPNTLVLGGGDDIAASVMSSLFRGAHMIEALNAAGLDVNTFGNHEFDYGPDNLATLIGESRFTWVSANVLDRRTGDVFGKEQGAARFVIRELDGVKVGITGIAPADTPTSSRPGPDVLVLDPEEALKEVVPRMRAAGAEVVVVLAHEAVATVDELAAAVPGVDVYLGDHTLQLLTEPQVIGGAIVSRVGAGLEYVGELTLRVADGKVIDWSFTLHDMGALVAAGDLEPDPETLAVIDKYAALAPSIMAEEIGRTETPLDARVDQVRSRETALGNFFADVLRAWAGADVGLVNGGGLRGDRVYGPGPLTRADIFSIMPFGNYAVKLRVTGAQLLAALEHGVSAVESLEGHFPQVSGITFTFDPAQPPGSRVSDVMVGGEALDLDREYAMATYDFLADGGSGYAMLVEAERLIPAESGDLVTSIVIDAIREAGVIAPEVEGRIQQP